MVSAANPRPGVLQLPNGAELSTYDWFEFSRGFDVELTDSLGRPKTKWVWKSPIIIADKREEYLIERLYLATIQPDVLKFAMLAMFVGDYQVATIPVWEVMQGRDLHKSVHVGGTEEWSIEITIAFGENPDVPKLFVSGWHNPKVHLEDSGGGSPYR